MTANLDREAARKYHDQTKHSYWSVRTTPHHLDFENMPSPFKIYPDLEPIPLSRDLLQSGMPALSSLAQTSTAINESELNIDRLAAFLYYTAGVTKKKTFPGGEIYFRAAACAGALYPVETYIVCGNIDGLAAGVYHFNAGDFSLRRLRDGDYRWMLAQATSQEQAVDHAPVLLVYSAISWRSTWKYRDRAYRYHFWDNGMIAANALAIAQAHNLPAKIVTGFVDESVNRLISIDGETVLALSIMALGRQDAKAQKPGGDQPPAELDLLTLPLSASRIDYTSIQQMHAASSLTKSEEVATWRDERFEQNSIQPSGETFALSQVDSNQLPDESLESVIQRRASTRRFAHKAITFKELSVILDRATRQIPADFLSSPATHINDLYMIINRVEGLQQGAYFYNRDTGSLELLKQGDFRERAAYLVLEQPLGGDASVTMFFMADLNSTLERLGNRGYRAAQMEAGIIGGKIYLSAYALGRGATGLTFYDDDVTEFFSPHASGKSCMLAVSIGVPGKKPLY